ACITFANDQSAKIKIAARTAKPWFRGYFSKIETQFDKNMLSAHIVRDSFFSELQQRYWENRPKSVDC
ncbi:MAG: hypothetical protein D6B28_10605, partial [Gammaproteobacteria bacterium]